MGTLQHERRHEPEVDRSDRWLCMERVLETVTMREGERGQFRLAAPVCLGDWRLPPDLMQSIRAPGGTSAVRAQR